MRFILLFFTVTLQICVNAQTTPYWFGRPDEYFSQKAKPLAQQIIANRVNGPVCTLKTDSAGRFVYLFFPIDTLAHKDQWREEWKYNATGDTVFHAIFLLGNRKSDVPWGESILFMKTCKRDSSGLFQIETYSAGATLQQTWSADSLLLREKKKEGLKKIDVAYTYYPDRSRKTKTVSYSGERILKVRYNKAGKISFVSNSLGTNSMNIRPAFTWYSYNRQGSLKRMHTHAWRKELRQHVKCSYTRDGRPLRVTGFIANENMEEYAEPLAFRKPVNGKWVYDKKGRLLSYECTDRVSHLITTNSLQNNNGYIRNQYIDSINMVLSFVGDRSFVNLYSFSQNGNVYTETYYKHYSVPIFPLNNPQKPLQLEGGYYLPYITMAWDSFYQHHVLQEYFLSGKLHRDTFIYDAKNQLIRKEKTVYQHGTGYTKTTINFIRNENGQCIAEEITCDTMPDKTSIRYVWNDNGICLVTDSLGMNGIHSYDSLSVDSRGDTAYHYLRRSNRAKDLHSEWISRYDSGRVMEMIYMENGTVVFHHTYTYNANGFPLKHCRKDSLGNEFMLEEWEYSPL
ncbi:MAG: hypothetical protein MUC87_01645 [Bacteroidia bacterium]|nr:hypothetical protein [Bacteroidia bacterium]